MNWELECNANLAKREQAMADARAVMMQSAVNFDRTLDAAQATSAQMELFSVAPQSSAIQILFSIIHPYQRLSNESTINSINPITVTATPRTANATTKTITKQLVIFFSLSSLPIRRVFSLILVSLELQYRPNGYIH